MKSDAKPSELNLILDYWSKHSRKYESETQNLVLNTDFTKGIL